MESIKFQEHWKYQIINTRMIKDPGYQIHKISNTETIYIIHMQFQGSKNTDHIVIRYNKKFYKSRNSNNTSNNQKKSKRSNLQKW